MLVITRPIKTIMLVIMSHMGVSPEIAAEVPARVGKCLKVLLFLERDNGDDLIFS